MTTNRQKRRMPSRFFIECFTYTLKVFLKRLGFSEAGKEESACYRVYPEVFDRYRETALEPGFGFVASGPLVRSSINAEEMYCTQNNGV